MVTIPCWWDGSISSLQATIQFVLPDTINTCLDRPIPLNPPINYFNSNPIPDVGELMLATFPNKCFTSSCSFWWIGEKYDGVRFCWNPVQKKVYTRHGSIIPSFAKFIFQFPAVFLDGEVWFGRGQFSKAVALIHNDSIGSSLRMIAFDIPISSNIYEKRFQNILKNVAANHAMILVVFRMLCSNDAHLLSFKQKIINKGGEGVILQKEFSAYESGKVSSLFKIKASGVDTEAVVVGVHKDKSVDLLMSNGKTFTVPPQNVNIPTPNTGSVISFSFNKTTSHDIPVDAKIVKLRTDVTWVQTKELPLSLGGVPYQAGYWTSKTMRLFFEQIATDLNLDPLQPETWYNISPTHISGKGGETILLKLKGYYKALLLLFPEVQFDKLKFLHIFKRWDTFEMRKKFFMIFAKKNKFDPLVPENWYTKTPSNITEEKGGSRVLEYYAGNLSRALVSLFPEVKWNESKWRIGNKWDDKKNRRAFFEHFAKLNGFDPLNPEHWYSQTFGNITAVKGGYRVLKYYSSNLIKALISLFPEVRWNISKWKSTTKWDDPRNRRLFFEYYAKLQNFDYLNPENWYDKTVGKIEGVAEILKYYDGSLQKSLMEIFPEVMWDPARWNQANKLDTPQKRRLFFENYANAKGFDPLNPENWYSLTTRSIKDTKGGTVLCRYNGLSDALASLFPELMWDAQKWRNFKKKWDEPQKRRIFFETYAKVHGFNPLNPENWYSVKWKHIEAIQGGATVMSYYSSPLSALSSLFPEVQWEKSNWKKNVATGT